METAAASHGSADRSCGQTRIVGGYGKSQYANQGRPVWKTGNKPACMTAKMVMPSVKRLIDVRHFCSSRYKIAEMNVPAWPIPIHQTKLTMPNAQATGMLFPQRPMPVIAV